MMVNIPEHVLAAFQVEGKSPLPAGVAWDNGARFERVVVAPASETAAWSAKVRERFSSPHFHVSRPVRATDGRVVVGGFKANDFLEGDVTSRIDEVMAAALAFDTAMVDAVAPPTGREDIFAEAERDAWQGVSLESPVGVGHADFLACCIFSGTLPPSLTDVVPTAEARPLGYTAALVLVDALVAQSVDTRIIGRWAHIPNLLFLAERALDYREFLAQRTNANISSEIDRVRSLLVSP